MSAWGTGISSNDTYEDIYDDFFESYNNGTSVADTSKQLIASNQDIIESFEDAHDFWFALATAQWETKQLDAKVLKRVTTIIKNDENIEVWRSLDASEVDLRKRKKVLLAYLEKIQSDRPNARKPHKKIPRTYYPKYNKGDCFMFKLDEKHYGGFIVLEARPTVGGDSNVLLAATTIMKTSPPKKEDFLNTSVPGRILTLPALNRKNQPEETKQKIPCIDRCDSRDLDAIKLVANIVIRREYDFDAKYYSYGSIEYVFLPTVVSMLTSSDYPFQFAIPIRYYRYKSLKSEVRKLLKIEPRVL